MKCLKGGRMRIELKEWLEKYDEKVKSFGFAFRRIDGGVPEKATYVRYKRYDGDFFYVFCFDDININPSILVDLYIRKRGKTKAFEHITTEQAFKILEEHNNF